MATVGGRSPGSRARPSRAFPSRAAEQWPDAMGVPGHSGGSAPDSHRLPEPPTLNRRDVTVAGAMTVNLTRIYTRLGDDGETHLGDMSRVPKTHPRIEAYGTVDELNAQLGVTLALPGLDERFAGFLRRVQNDLFDVGADISVPHGGDRTRLRLAPEQTAWLEQACDEVNATLEPLRSFVLPGGSPAAAQLHVCRTVCRRAERRTIDCGDDVNRECVRYLNRLSDLLFILARAANEGDEPLWEPGRYR
jgi:cob(I)alamin adenosyltransferase